MSAELLVITPTRGRPARIRQLLQAWYETSSGRAELVLCTDEDDPDAEEVGMLADIEFCHWLHGPGRRRLAGWTNAVATSVGRSYPYVASFGDDHVPRTPGWDGAICDALAAMGGAGMVYPDDGFEHETLPTAIAMTSTIVAALGWMCLPTLQHLYVDHVWRDLGAALSPDRYRYLPDVLLEHSSNYNGKAEWDDLAREIRDPAAFAADEKAYGYWTGGDRENDIARMLCALKLL